MADGVLVPSPDADEPWRVSVEHAQNEIKTELIG